MNAEYPKWFVDLIQSVLDMRDAQADYFKQPNEYRLKVSKSREKSVDNALEFFKKKGLIASKPKLTEQQKKLF